MANFYSIITNRGKELEAESLASGIKITLTQFVVGDGNGQAVLPKPTQTKLINEKYRGAIGELSVAPDQPSQMMAKVVLPTDVGGFTVREIGVLTDAGELYAVANCATIEKPVGGVSVNMQFRLAVSDTANVTLNVATGDGLFLRIDQDLSEIRGRGAAAQKKARESLAVVDASTKQKGLVQLNSATNSTSETQAATPAAVKAANDNANGRVPSTLKVNNKALSGDITLSADDVVAVPGVINGSMTMASANKSGWWQVAVPDTSKSSDFPKKPNGSKLYGYGYMFVWVTGNTWFQHYIAHHGEVAYRQAWEAGPSASVEWTIDYNTANKPAAAEVDAVSASGGGTFKGVVYFNNVVRIEKTYPGLTLRDTSAADSLVGKDILLEASGGNVRLLFRKKDSTDNQLMLSFPKVAGTLYSTGNKPSAGDVGAYSKSEGDARYQAKGNYTPAGQAYTKSESDARFLNWNYNAIGSVCFARFDPQNQTIAPNGTTAGSNLHAAGITGYPDAVGGDWMALRVSGTLSGTWRCLGSIQNDTDQRGYRHYSVSLFVRIA